MNRNFGVHGQIKIYTIGQIFVTEVVGPWNSELTILWTRELKPVVQEIARNGPIGGITVFQGSMLFTPESLDITRRSNEYGAENLPIVATAHVVGRDVEGGKLMAKVLAERERAYWPVASFEQFEDALAWVQMKLSGNSSETKGRVRP